MSNGAATLQEAIDVAADALAELASAEYDGKTVVLPVTVTDEE